MFFLFLHKNITCGYSLEVPHRGTSNEYPQYMLCGEIFLKYFYFSTKTYVLIRSHSLEAKTEVLLICTHNICFLWRYKKNISTFGLEKMALISGTMVTVDFFFFL